MSMTAILVDLGLLRGEGLFVEVVGREEVYESFFFLGGVLGREVVMM